MTLTDGRGELYQWDTGRTLTVDDATITQVHFQNRAYGRTIDVDVKDGSAIIPDEILQKPGDLRVYAFSGTAASGFTKVERVYNIIRRNKPNDYMYTPTEQKSLDGLQKQIGNLDDLTTAAKNNLVAAINETATAGQTPGLTGVAVGQIPVVKAVDSSGKPTEWEAIDIPQSDWEQTDESAADYVKNRPFGSFAHHSINFSVNQGNTKFEGDHPGFDTLSGVVGEKPAHIEANGYIYCQGKAVTVLDDENGDITITFTSDDNLNELVFSGRYGNLTRLTINKSNITWEPWNTYSLFIDGLTYTIYKKLSSYSVEGTLPETNRNDHILVSSVDGSWNVTPVENINPIFRLSGASAGQIAKIAAVDTSGKPTSWEAVDMPSGGGEYKLLYDGSITVENVNAMQAELIQSCEGMTEFAYEMSWTKNGNTNTASGSDSMALYVGDGCIDYGRLCDPTNAGYGTGIFKVLKYSGKTRSIFCNTRSMNRVDSNAPQAFMGITGSNNPNYDKWRITTFAISYTGTISLKLWGR